MIDGNGSRKKAAKYPIKIVKAAKKKSKENRADFVTESNGRDCMGGIGCFWLKRVR